MAQRLATDAAARARRDDTLRGVLAVRGVGDAVEVAGRIVQAATEDAKALTAERDEAERSGLLRTLGIAEGAAVPPAVRSQLARARGRSEAPRDPQPARRHRPRAHRPRSRCSATCSCCSSAGDRDGDLINRELEPELRALAAAWTPERTLIVVDQHRRDATQPRAERRPHLALESMLVTVASGRTP